MVLFANFDHDPELVLFVPDIVVVIVVVLVQYSKGWTIPTTTSI